ncbi:MAG: isoprenoid biosynthesis glyoxalase ElbB [Bacteroidetes bacterium]|nr:isoprenoid biosynthesis glyoxalase ElbB [Bacteroidota bacterium]
MKVGILLSGCGVYDGAEIQEAVFTMLAIEEIGASYQCIGINANQHHVINHFDGSESNETRNMLHEAARIARGNIIDIESVKLDEIDALVIPGGFGSAKNFTKWAFNGPDGDILKEVKLLLVNLYNIGKPIVALCVSPVVVAKALEGNSRNIELTIGSIAEESPYDINAFQEGLSSSGVKTKDKTRSEIHVDEVNRIITAPCYMMETTTLQVRDNIQQAIFALKKLLQTI